MLNAQLAALSFGVHRAAFDILSELGRIIICRSQRYADEPSALDELRKRVAAMQVCASMDFQAAPNNCLHFARLLTARSRCKITGDLVAGQAVAS